MIAIELMAHRGQQSCYFFPSLSVSLCVEHKGKEKHSLPLQVDLRSSENEVPFLSLAPFFSLFPISPLFTLSGDLESSCSSVIQMPCDLALGCIRFCDSVASTVESGLTLSLQTLQGRWEISQGHTAMLPRSVDALRCASPTSSTSGMAGCTDH